MNKEIKIKQVATIELLEDDMIFASGKVLLTDIPNDFKKGQILHIEINDFLLFDNFIEPTDFILTITVNDTDIELKGTITKFDCYSPYYVILDGKLSENLNIRNKLKEDTISFLVISIVLILFLSFLFLTMNNYTPVSDYQYKETNVETTSNECVDPLHPYSNNSSMRLGTVCN